MAVKKAKHLDFSVLNSEKMQILLNCMGACSACSKLCIEEGHKKTAILCEECSDICSLTAKLVAKNSEFADHMLEICARACKKCADACGKMDAPHCQECAETCWECAEACTYL